MHKKNLCLFILGLTLLACTNSFGGISSAFKNREWEFLEYKFIDKPKALTQKYRNAIGAISFTGFVSSVLLSVATTERLEPDAQTPSICALSAFAFLIMSVPANLVLEYYKDHQLLTVIFKSLIINWPKYKTYVPEEFHEAFGGLYERYGVDINALPENQALKLVKIMQEAVKNRNPKKYYNKIIDGRPQPQLVIHTRTR